jgi:succinoglycan biosynthesis transport protein ExoP
LGLDQYLAILRRRWLTVLSVTLLALLANTFISRLTTPYYDASTSVFFSVNVGTTAGSLSRGFDYGQDQVRAYAELADLPVVLTPVTKTLGFPSSAKELNRVAKSVTSRAPTDEPIVDIIVHDTSPRRAAAVANAIAAQLVITVESIAPKVGAGTDVTTDAVTARVVAPAAVPHAATNLRSGLNLLVAIVVGLGLGSVGAIWFDVRHSRYLRGHDLAVATNASFVARVLPPRSRIRLRGALAGRRSRAEALAHLDRGLHALVITQRIRRLAVAPATDRGPTIDVVAELAGRLSRHGLRVLIMDGGDRLPELAFSQSLASPGLGMAQPAGRGESPRANSEATDFDAVLIRIDSVLKSAGLLDAATVGAVLLVTDTATARDGGLSDHIAVLAAADVPLVGVIAAG